MSDTTLHLHPEVASHDVYEEEHHGHHKETFISKYVFSMDHKTISKQFLITGIFWAIIGGFFSVLFRLQLGFPDQSFPFLETLFGHWAQGGKISPEFYYALITMHGTILVFFVLTAGLSGTYANLLIPLQIGARDMASPFLNMLSYWFFFMAFAFAKRCGSKPRFTFKCTRPKIIIAINTTAEKLRISQFAFLSFRFQIGASMIIFFSLIST